MEREKNLQTLAQEIKSCGRSLPESVARPKGFVRRADYRYRVDIWFT